MIVQQRLPYLLQQSAQVLTIEGHLLPMRYASRELRAIGKPTAIHRILFAYRIPYLPDQLSSLHLVGSTERERLVEILDQDVRLIANLGKRKNMAFALRFHADPNVGEIKIALVVRVIAPKPQPVDLYRHLAYDIASLFGSFDYPVEPVLSESDLHEVLLPMSNPMILEIRQHEELAAMIHGDAYVVYPFRPRHTTWITVCRTMLQQSAPSVLNIYLEPTQLYAFEQDLFSRSAQLAETLADVQYEGYITRGRIVDPIARAVARLYSDYVQRFLDPFLLVVQVASPDLLTAQSVAQALAAELTETHSFSEAVQSDSALPSGYDLVAPRSDTELEMAKRTFKDLEFLLARISPGLSWDGQRQDFALLPIQVPTLVE